MMILLAAGISSLTSYSRTSIKRMRSGNFPSHSDFLPLEEEQQIHQISQDPVLKLLLVTSPRNYLDYNSEVQLYFPISVPGFSRK